MEKKENNQAAVNSGKLLSTVRKARRGIQVFVFFSYFILTLILLLALIGALLGILSRVYIGSEVSFVFTILFVMVLISLMYAGTFSLSKYSLGLNNSLKSGTSKSFQSVFYDLKNLFGVLLLLSVISLLIIVSACLYEIF